ncbi:hypothetical protein B0O80DRAFT_51859 [Mortierella sp. GBAus27b]|nr:hypothetical protein B0O80DRAFT_51859 [Mortierella sp. GBAus27b]
MINNQECPGWTWHHRHSGVPRMDLALSTTRSAQDGLGTINNQGNMDKRECPGWTQDGLRMDSQDGLSGWTSGMDLATWTVDNIRIRQLWTYPRSDTKDQQILGYQLSAICLYPRSVCRKQIHDFSTVGNVGILSEVYNSRLLESEGPSAKLQQILGESALGSIRGSVGCPFGHPDHAIKSPIRFIPSGPRERSTARLMQSQTDGMVWVMPASRTPEHCVCIFCLCSTDRVSRPLLALPRLQQDLSLSSTRYHTYHATIYRRS